MGKLADLTPEIKVEPCKAGRLLIELDKEDADILAAAYDDTRWTPFSLAKALQERGIRITADTIRFHVRKSCRCSRT